MIDLIDYAGNHIGALTVILALAVVAVVLAALYQRERARAGQIAEQVAGERDFYRVFAEHAESCFLLVRKNDLRPTYVSPNFQRITGMDPERVRPDVEALREVVSRKTARRVVQGLREWDGQEVFRMEIPFQVEGAEHWGSLSVHAEGDYYLGTLADITQEHQNLLELRGELEKANRESQAKTDFLSKMSHEIRTPMNGIIGMLNLAMNYLEDTAATEGYLRRAEKLSQFLLTLINDILDMSRIESGKMELEKVPFDLFEVADKLNSMFKNTAEAKGLHWEIRMQDFDVRRVVGDELRLTQVIINFISNANKFTPAGGTVSVTFRQMSKIDNMLHLMIRVRDTGKGIKADFLSHIFRPFEQEDASTAHHYGGSGLGMAIADNIVRLMDGQIIVESEEGKGTEFVVYLALPIAEGDQTLPDSMNIGEAVGHDADKQRTIEEYTLEGVHLLMAEDNDINAEIAMELLQLEGVEIERACDGLDAVRMFSESAPGTYDAILMDIQMPNMDGWEATGEIRKLKRDDADIPIFAMSANAFVEDKRHSLEIGMNGHISKPVDFDEVRRVLAECLYTAAHPEED